MVDRLALDTNAERCESSSLSKVTQKKKFLDKELGSLNK